MVDVLYDPRAALLLQRFRGKSTKALHIRNKRLMRLAVSDLAQHFNLNSTTYDLLFRANCKQPDAHMVWPKCSGRE